MIELESQYSPGETFSMYGIDSVGDCNIAICDGNNTMETYLRRDELRELRDFINEQLGEEETARPDGAKERPAWMEDLERRS